MLLVLLLLLLQCGEISWAIEQLQQRASTTEGRVSDAEAMLSRHDNGLVQLDHAVRRIVERGPRHIIAQPQQPGFGASFGADFQSGSGGAAGPVQAPHGEARGSRAVRPSQRPWRASPSIWAMETL